MSFVPTFIWRRFFNSHWEFPAEVLFASGPARCGHNFVASVPSQAIWCYASVEHGLEGIFLRRTRCSVWENTNNSVYAFSFQSVHFFE